MEHLLKMELSGFPDGLDIRYERKDAAPNNLCTEVILGLKTKEESKRPLGWCPLLACDTSACNLSQVKLIVCPFI